MGRNTVNAVPRSSSLCTSIRPLWACTMPHDTDKPSPVPIPIGLVVKKGSKIRLRLAALIPWPVSLIRNPPPAPYIAASEHQVI